MFKKLVYTVLLWRMVRRDNDCGWEGKWTERAIRWRYLTNHKKVCTIKT